MLNLTGFMNLKLSVLQNSKKYLQNFSEGVVISKRARELKKDFHIKAIYQDFKEEKGLKNNVTQHNFLF